MISNIELLGRALCDSENGSVEVSKEVYWHFLEVLPPFDIGRYWFIFREGDGDIYHFENRGDSYYCKLNVGQMVTTDWHAIATITRTTDDSFKLLRIDMLTDDDVPDNWAILVNQLFDRPNGIEQAMGVQFR